MIVIEDVAPDGQFSFYMQGDKERLSDKSVSDNDLTAAEFWGSKMFELCIGFMKSQGLLKKEFHTDEVVH